MALGLSWRHVGSMGVGPSWGCFTAVVLWAGRCARPRWPEGAPVAGTGPQVGPRQGTQQRCIRHPEGTPGLWLLLSCQSEISAVTCALRGPGDQGRSRPREERRWAGAAAVHRSPLWPATSLAPPELSTGSAPQPPPAQQRPLKVQPAGARLGPQGGKQVPCRAQVGSACPWFPGQHFKSRFLQNQSQARDVVLNS